jgi:flavorubredoxin
MMTSPCLRRLCYTLFQIGLRSINQSAAHEDLFVIHCRLEKGTTYNSFLIFGEKTALVDASHEKFRGLYMDTLKEQLKAAGRSLDYVLVSHTEPDHSGSPRPSTPGLPAMLFMGAKDSWLFLSIAR